MRHRSRLVLTLGLVLVALTLALAMAPAPALAGTSGDGTYTLHFPDGYYACDPADNITVSGVPQGWWVLFKFFKFNESSLAWEPISDVWVENTAGGDVSVAFPYGGQTGNFLVTARVTDREFGAPIGQLSGKWWVKCDTPPPPDGEGCTPGYWRNHLEVAAIDPYNTYFDGVFGVGPHISLAEAVVLRGGQENALLRHAAAGYLNITSGLDYGFSASELIALVQSAYSSGDFNGVKDQIEDANELYCPLN